MWLLIPIALVAAALLGRKGRSPTPTTPEETPGTRPVGIAAAKAVTADLAKTAIQERTKREMAMNLHLSGKRYGIWREQAGVLMQVALSNDDMEKDFRDLPINPNQALYYWDSKVSTREPKAVRVRLMS